MMGKQNTQLQMIILDMDAMIPPSHLLKKIDQIVDFSFIYERAAGLYATNGRPSIDPVVLIKMLLIGYMYGIKSERRLEQEVNLNIAYRWFCGLQLTDRVPDHSTFSQNRRRRFRTSDIFQEIFYEIVRQCIDQGLVDGEYTVCDGSFLPAEVSRSSHTTIETTIRKSMQSYLDVLDEELAAQPGYKLVGEQSVVIDRATSKTDPDCGFMHKGKKSGMGYLVETTVDCSHGIITGVDVYPANQKESSIVLKHLEKQILANGLKIKRIALDGGYDVGAVHRGLELMGIEGYIPAIPFSNTPEKQGFVYQPHDDCFVCPQGQTINYDKLYCVRTTGNFLRCYLAARETCQKCPQKLPCLGKEKRRRILASSFYPAFNRGHERAKGLLYDKMMRLRAIWSEGTFSVLKREHKMKTIQKRGIVNAREECLLASIALNLKRMVKALPDKLKYGLSLVFCLGFMFPISQRSTH
ncbi:MAG: IS1182 family transposase [Syntrophomonadaceae bacterium]